MTAAAAAAADAADAAAYAADAAAAATVWEAVSADCEWMEVQRAGGRLIDRPLWLVDVRGERKYGANLPRWVRAPLDAFASSETGRGRSWKLIVDWYRAILPNRRDGAPRSLFGEKADIAIATQPDAFWTMTAERSADRSMGEVAEIVGLAALGSLPQYPIGNSWRESDKRLLVLDQRGTISDTESAGTPVVIQLHEGIKRRIRDFSPVAARVEDEHGWENFASSFQRLSATLVCETNEIPLRIGMAYDVAIEFASFLDQDNELRKRPKGNMSCLDAERRRAFENIVIAVAPWIRRFPTAREIDDEAGSYLGHVPDRLLAIEIANSARGAELISDAGSPASRGYIVDTQGTWPPVREGGRAWRVYREEPHHRGRVAGGILLHGRGRIGLFDAFRDREPSQRFSGSIRTADTRIHGRWTGRPAQLHADPARTDRRGSRPAPVASRPRLDLFRRSTRGGWKEARGLSVPRLTPSVPHGLLRP